MALFGAAWAQRQLRLPSVPMSTARPVLGAYHLHSTRSHDGRASLDDYARAARASGLEFLLVTEHDRQLPEPRRLHGVLLVPACELNSPDGHLVSVGAARALDDRERYEPMRADHVRRLGGRALAAHPTSGRRPWTGSCDDLDGIEVQNAAASLEQAAGPWSLGALPLLWTYAVAPTLALAQLYRRDADAHALWDAMEPNAIGLAGNDAHGWLMPARDLSPWWLALPASVRPSPPEALSQEAVVAALHGGQATASAGLWGGALALETSLVGPQDGERHLRACAGSEPRADGPWQLAILRDGGVVAEGPGPCLEVRATGPATYRAELRAWLPTWWGGRYLALVAFGGRTHVP